MLNLTSSPGGRGSVSVVVFTMSIDHKSWMPFVDAVYGSAVYLPMADGARYEVAITQSGFVGTPGAKGAAGHWTLPVCVKTAGTAAATCAIVTEPSQTVKAPGCGAAMINADGHGYYFTEYEPAAVAALAHRDPPLTAPERISLLGDEWRIVRAGRHDIDTYMDLAAAFASDPTPQVASEIASRLAFVRGSIADAAQRPSFDPAPRAGATPAASSTNPRAAASRSGSG